MSGYELTGFDGKVAVVTGAGRRRSIGRSIALALARSGCDVVLTGTGRPPDRYPPDEQAVGWRDIDSVADEVRALGRRAIAVVSDVADRSAVEALADRVMSELGRVDIVVNNASVARGDDRRPLVEVDPELFARIQHVNVHGPFLMSRTFGRLMIDAGRGGCIVNISSIAGKLFGANTGAYAASKAALQALTAVMSQEVGRYGIRVNAICPGIVDTARMDDMRSRFDDTVRRMVPLGRAGLGDDIAAVAVFLCSDQGSWVTGQSWNVDGGTVVQH